MLKNARRFKVFATGTAGTRCHDFPFELIFIQFNEEELADIHILEKLEFIAEKIVPQPICFMKFVKTIFLSSADLAHVDHIYTPRYRFAKTCASPPLEHHYHFFDVKNLKIYMIWSIRTYFSDMVW